MPFRAPFDVVPRFPSTRPGLLLALVLGCGGATAQELPAPLIDADTRVLPVWSNASGRVEALLLLDPVDPSQPASPLDRVLRAQAPTLGLGSRVDLAGDGQLQTSLQLEHDSGLALLCEGQRGLAGTLGALGDRCLLAALGHEDPLLGGNSRAARFDLDWRSASGVFDLSFGLSWLDYAPAPAAALAGDALLSSLGLGPDPELGGAFAGPLQSRGLHLDGLIHLGPQTRVLLGSDLNSHRGTALDGSTRRWESTALSVGLGYGDFSGLLTGRLVELPRGGQWNALDIGVSWRTPWRGELSIGATRVLGTPDRSAWPLDELPAIEEPGSRVPYVRYQQDL